MYRKICSLPAINCEQRSGTSWAWNFLNEIPSRTAKNGFAECGCFLDLLPTIKLDWYCLDIFEIRSPTAKKGLVVCGCFFPLIVLDCRERLAPELSAEELFWMFGISGVCSGLFICHVHWFTFLGVNVWWNTCTEVRTFRWSAYVSRIWVLICWFWMLCLWKSCT